MITINPEDFNTEDIVESGWYAIRHNKDGRKSMFYIDIEQDTVISADYIEMTFKRFKELAHERFTWVRIEMREHLTEDMVKAQMHRDAVERYNRVQQHIGKKYIVRELVGKKFELVKDPAPMPEDGLYVMVRIPLGKDDMVGFYASEPQLGVRYANQGWYMCPPPMGKDGMMRAPFFVRDEDVIDYEYCNMRNPDEPVAPSN